VLVERRFAACTNAVAGGCETASSKVVLSGRDPQNVISDTPGSAGRADPIRVRSERDADDVRTPGFASARRLVERRHSARQGDCKLAQNATIAGTSRTMSRSERRYRCP
jgi:hypothetical protein